MVIWESWLESAGSSMGVTTSQAGVMLGMFLTIAVVITILIATKGKNGLISASIIVFCMSLMFTYMGWFPTWTGSGIALVSALFLGRTVAGWFRSG